MQDMKLSKHSIEEYKEKILENVKILCLLRLFSSFSFHLVNVLYRAHIALEMFLRS
jgi:uncharacterized membrane protein YdjX (TVP38/TMEM64 family)